MSHVPSLFPSQLSSTSLSTLSTCSPIRPSTRPSTRPFLVSSSHGDFPCADPSNVSFGHMAETTSPAGYEPKDLTEETNSKLVKQMFFFHRPSMTSSYDSAENIATLPSESTLDDDQIRNMVYSTREREKQVLTDHVFITLNEKTQCPVHLTAAMIFTQKQVESRNTFRHRRHFLRTSTSLRKR